MALRHGAPPSVSAATRWQLDPSPPFSPAPIPAGGSSRRRSRRTSCAQRLPGFGGRLSSGQSARALWLYALPGPWPGIAAATATIATIAMPTAMIPAAPAAQEALEIAGRIIDRQIQDDRCYPDLSELLAVPAPGEERSLPVASDTRRLSLPGSRATPRPPVGRPWPALPGRPRDIPPSPGGLPTALAEPGAGSCGPCVLRERVRAEAAAPEA